MTCEHTYDHLFYSVETNQFFLDCSKCNSRLVLIEYFLQSVKESSVVNVNDMLVDFSIKFESNN